MKAVYIKEFGGIINLEFCELEDLPLPKSEEVLVRVRASALNRADLLQRRGLYPAPKGFSERILGLEFAGEVAEIGENVNDFKLGDRVFGITAGGGQAEFVSTKAFQLAKIPDNLNFIEAACIPEAFITAHDAIFTQAHLQENENLLIHAVGSGVGLAALQLAKAKNIKVYGTSRNSDKLDRSKQFGLDEAILVNENVNFSEQAKGVDVVLDLVGAKYFAENLQSLNLKGRLILVGLTGGRKSEFDLALALTKRLKIIGTVLRSRTNDEKSNATQKFIKEVLPLFEKGLIRPNLDKVFKAHDVRKAHEYLESNKSFGKVVLEF
jgi:putative PIG3 family NAD(P)H quinone oxidoreductase